MMEGKAGGGKGGRGGRFLFCHITSTRSRVHPGGRDKKSKVTKSGKGHSYTCSLTKNQGNKGGARSFWNKSNLVGNYWEYILQWPW